MKALKILCQLIGIFLLLTIIAAIALPQLVDPNDYKEEITTTVKSHTGLDLVINGDLSLSVFPWLGIKTGQVSLAQPTEIAASGDFVRVDEANIKVKLKPLLERKLEVDTILLKSPHIHIIVNTKGLSSIDAIAHRFQDKPAPTQTNTEDNEDNNNNNDVTAIAALTIAGINISDGAIIYDDKQANASYQINALNITSGNLLNGDTAPFYLAGNISGDTIEPVTLSIESLITLDTEGLNATFNKVKLSGDFADIPVSAAIPEATVNAKTTTAIIPQFTLESQGVTLSGDLRVSNWNQVPTAVGHLTTNTFDARPLLETFGIDYVPTKTSALSKIQNRVTVTASSKGVSLQNIKLSVDESLLVGNIAVTNLANPQYRFDISLDSILVDSYLPKPDLSDNSDQPESANAATGLLAPLAIFNDIQAKGDFKAGSIQSNDLTISEVKVNIDSNASATTMTSILSLYEGSLDGVVNLTKAKNPELTINTTLSDIALEPLLIDASVTDQLSGTGNVKADVKITEKEGQTLQTGIIKLHAKDGAIKGIDIKKIIREAKRITQQQTNDNSPTSNTNATTHFADMTATLLLNNHIIENNDLKMKAPALRVEGQGSIDLTTQTAEYLTSIFIAETSKGQGGKDRSDLSGITIPVKTTGPLTNLKHTIDTKLLLKRFTERYLDKEKNQLQDKLLKKLGIQPEQHSTTANDASNKTTKESSQQQEQPNLEDSLKEKLKQKLFKKLF